MIYKLITHYEYSENGTVNPIQVHSFLAIMAKKGT